ncbi:TonB-dependent receptor [Asticcacaulis sp. AC402]|uniref:TonB-dependent receptor n=1 Tax=Asticcacaulis sp. AC402 TaxID=1282361 RepID=UPI0003C3D86B|nr:TonB-dependent receptor [Asticcacaulis sp. AC402]ESQ77447.1 hypothetical protein ABAC402_01205 [Asticcacaulis sp. AC402]
MSYLHNGLRCALMASAAVAVIAAPAYAQATRSFNIPAQDAVTAVPQFAQQSGLQVLASADDLRGVRTNPVKGPLKVDAALTQLVAGTGLNVRTQDGNSAVIVRASMQTATTESVAGPVNAQPVSSASAAADDDVAQVVIVRGKFAGTLKKARNVKRDAQVVVESISLTDLGQLPDVSIADALARLPGLAADRDPNNGAASQISLRGLPTEMLLGTMNGRDLASSTPNRNIRYDQYPTELVGGVLVYKSSMASIPEGGIAGSIDLRTINPLDVRKNEGSVAYTRVFAPSAGKFAQGDDSGYRASLSYMGRSDDKKFGYAFGIATRDEPFSSVRTQHGSYNPSTYQDRDGDGQNDIVTYGVLHQGGVGKDKRDGAFGTLAFKPNDRLFVLADALYSSVKYNKDASGLYVNNTSQLWANTYSNSVVDGNKLVAGTITNNIRPNGIRISNQNTFSRRDDVFSSLGINAKYKLDDLSWIDVDLSTSSVTYLSEYGEILTDVSVSAPAPSVTFDARSDLTTIALNVDLTDKALNPLTQMSVPYHRDGVDDAVNYRIDYHRDFASGEFFDKFIFGIRSTDRQKSEVSSQQDVTIAPTQIASDLILPFALGAYSGPQDQAPRFMTFNFFDVANRYFGGYNPTNASTNSQTASWVVHEKTLAVFGQLDFKGTLFGIDYTGNAGVRVVETQDESSSVRLVATPAGSSLEPYVVTNEYTDVLPSVSFNFRPNENWILRLGIAQTIARPAIEDLNAGFSAFDFGAPQAYGGNPLLEPFRADQIDITSEWYFGSNNFFAVAAYHKNLKNYITTSSQFVDIDGTLFQFFQPVNRQGGYIRGIEFTYQQQFDQLPAPWDGLGVYANLALADSDVKVSRNFSAETLGLNNMSKNVGTLSAYYYKSGFELRGSYRFRSRFSRVVDGGGFESNEPEGIVDVQASYDFSNGVSLVLQGQNLNNAPYKTTLGSPDIHGRYEDFGTYYYAGVRAKF